MKEDIYVLSKKTLKQTLKRMSKHLNKGLSPEEVDKRHFTIW